LKLCRQARWNDKKKLTEERLDKLFSDDDNEDEDEDENVVI
jgi:hypothetical protein